MRRLNTQLATSVAWVVGLLATSGAAQDALTPASQTSAATEASSATDVDLVVRPSHVGGGIETLGGFVANLGQWDDEVLFVARSGGIELTLTRDAMVFTPRHDPESEDSRPEPFVLRLPGDGASTLTGKTERPTKHHFLLGPIEQHVSNVPSFEQVVYDDVAAGIDLLVRREASGFAYDLHVEPGADLASLELSFEGASAPELRADGSFHMQTAFGPVEQRVGASWNVATAEQPRREVASGFELRNTEGEPGDSLRLGFLAPERDASRAFVLDPSVIFATYVGGSFDERFEGMHVADDGSVYLLCATLGAMPTTPGAHSDTPIFWDAWFGKLAPDGATLEWATYLGGGDGTGNDQARGLHVDTDGTVIGVGQTWAGDFPTTPGSLQPATGSPGLADLWITRLAADGSSIVWSTYYGGPNQEDVDVTALAPSGDVIVIGPAPAGMPAASPSAYDTVWDPDDAYIMCVSSDGSTRVFQSFFRRAISDVAVNDAGEIHLAGGWRAEYGAIATPGAFQELLPAENSQDGVLMKMDALCTQIEWATYLGAGESDNILGMAFSPSGCIVVGGNTSSEDFPVTAGAFDTTHRTGSGNYVAKFLPDGTSLAWATFIESNGAFVFYDLVVDEAGNAIIAIATNGDDYPTTPDAFEPVFNDPGVSGEVGLTKFDAFGESLEYSTYYGGDDQEGAVLLGLDQNQILRMGLRTHSDDIHVTPGSLQQLEGGSYDMHVSAWDLDLLPWRVLGGGMKGTDHTPDLAGTGELTLGAPTRFSVRGAAPFAPAWFVVGLSQIDAPLKGGTLVPALDFLVKIQPDTDGAYDLAFPWIAAPAGIDVFIQAWIQDPGGPVGWSASNALQLTSQ